MPEVFTIISLALTAASMIAAEKQRKEQQRKQREKESQPNRQSQQNPGKENVTAGEAAARSEKAEAVGAGGQAVEKIVEKTGAEAVPGAKPTTPVTPEQTQTKPMEAPQATAGVSVKPTEQAAPTTTATATTTPPIQQTDTKATDGPLVGPGPKEQTEEAPKPDTKSSGAGWSTAKEMLGSMAAAQAQKEEAIRQIAEQSRLKYEAERARRNDLLWYKGGTSSG